MGHQISVNKLDAAQRQLRAAIRLMFDGGDPVAVHSLVGAASIIVSNLVEQNCPESSWDKMAQEANGLSASKYFSIMRNAQNFFKHAAKDSDVTLEFDPDDTDALALGVTLNLGELSKVMPVQLAIEEQVLQLWYLACREPIYELDFEPYSAAIALLGDLHKEPRDIRLAAGRLALQKLSKIS